VFEENLRGWINPVLCKSIDHVAPSNTASAANHLFPYCPPNSRFRLDAAALGNQSGFSDEWDQSMCEFAHVLFFPNTTG
jgi:hypothetical protein